MESRPEAWPLKAAGGQSLGFPHPCRSGGGQDFTSELPYFVDGGGGRGNPWLITACLCGGMSGMFGIWVFTSQGAHGSLVLKCDFFLSLRRALVGLDSGFKPRAATGCCKAVSPFQALSPLTVPLGNWSAGCFAVCREGHLQSHSCVPGSALRLCPAEPTLCHPCGLRNGDSEKSPQPYRVA